MAQLKSSKVTGDLNVTGEANVGTKITVNGNEVWDEGNLLNIGTTAETARTALELGAGATRWPTFAEVTGKPATYAPSGHTHPTSQVTGLDTTLAGKANTSTQVIAGTGLSGGGTLAANRTLAVSYGTAAGTAAQGNDSRLSNSREWTASTVSQAEAEAGTATTARKWTAQRVRQAANSSIAAKSGSVNGIASLDGNGKIPLSQLSDSIIGQVEYMGLWAASTNTPTLPTTPAEKGHYYVVSASGTQFGLSFEVGDWAISNGTSWDKVDNTDAVSSVNGRTGNITGLAESNDSRFTNSREWTASVVSQAEAEAGTATTARKWTAQRVAQAISALGLKIGTTASTAKAGNWVPTWANVTGKPTTFTPSAHTHSLSQITDAGSVASLNTNASTVNFLRGDGTWATPPNTNTTYSEITTAEIDAGTASTSRTITGRRMKYALDTKANTSTQVIAGTGLTGGGTLAANRTLAVSYGTAAGTAAQGDDSRITGALQKSQVVQATGTSTTNVMSQKVTTDQLATKAASSHTHPWAQVTGQPATATRWPTFAEVTGKPVVQTTGDSTTNIMSQKAITDAINAAVANIDSSSGPRPIKDHGQVARYESETVTCDVQESDFHIMNMNLSQGTLTIDFSNMPDTVGKHYSWHVRLRRGGIKPIVFVQTISWAGGVEPTFGNSFGSQDLIMFYKVDDETIRGMVIDAW